jgi:hypothetical protein
MSQKNGNRSRFDIQRKAKMHDRTRIRALQTALKQQKAGSDQKSDSKSS